MQTHEDSQHLDMNRLRERASNAMASGASTITAGQPPIETWDEGNIHVEKLPNDEQGILRISTGGGAAGIDYCVFRGNRIACIDLLDRAAQALRARPKADTDGGT